VLTFSQGKAVLITGKTCSHYRESLLIAVNLFTKQGFPWTPPVLPCTGLQCMYEPLGTVIAHMLATELNSM
jgi:hypothetical protein